MPTHRQRFTGSDPEDFPDPPIARRLLPGDVIEYDADEPIAHARLELTTDEPPAGWERLSLHWPGAAVVIRGSEASTEAATPPPPRTRKATTADPANSDPASPDKE